MTINDTVSFENKDITAQEYLEMMFERTDCDGILYLPDWTTNYTGWETHHPGAGNQNVGMRCRMKWTVCDMDNLLVRYQQLRRDIDLISPHHKSIYMTLPYIRQTLTDPRLLAVWEKYLAPSDSGDVSIKEAMDIADRMETMETVQNIAAELSKGNRLGEYEKGMLIDHMDLKVTDEEKERYNSYIKAIHKDAEKRIGAGICAYRVIFLARRLSVLLHLKAPQILIRNEERDLIRAMALHQYCTALESVSNDLRLQMERLIMMSDEDLDVLASPHKTNSRKSMAPLFVYLILKENRGKHLKQQEILDQLEAYPYEIIIERKALSRIVHNLADSQLSVYVDKTGAWFE